MVQGSAPLLSAGVALSIFLHLYRISIPHVAIVGQVPGTQHFRNVKRHTMVTDPEIMSIRVDDSPDEKSAMVDAGTLPSAKVPLPPVR